MFVIEKDQDENENRSVQGRSDLIVISINTCLCFIYIADIVFIVKDKQHPRFRREGTNLIHTAKVPLGKALTGCTVDIVTLDERTLHIPINDIIQ